MLRYLLCLILIHATNAYGSCQALVPANKEPILLYTEHWPPYQRVLSTGEVSGIATDKIVEVLKRYQWPYEIQAMPWARAIHLVNKNIGSFIYSAARFKEREDKFQWIAPLAQANTKIVRFNNNKVISISNLVDIQNYNLILKRGEASSTLITENHLTSMDKVIWVNDSSQALKLLRKGRGDLYTVNIDGFEEAIKSSKMNKDDFSFVYDFVELNVDLYLATSNKTSLNLVDSLRELFSCHLSQISY